MRQGTESITILVSLQANTPSAEPSDNTIALAVTLIAAL